MRVYLRERKAAPAESDPLQWAGRRPGREACHSAGLLHGACSIHVPRQDPAHHNRGYSSKSPLCSPPPCGRMLAVHVAARTSSWPALAVLPVSGAAPNGSFRFVCQGPTPALSMKVATCPVTHRGTRRSPSLGDAIYPRDAISSIAPVSPVSQGRGRGERELRIRIGIRVIFWGGALGIPDASNNRMSDAPSHAESPHSQRLTTKANAGWAHCLVDNFPCSLVSAHQAPVWSGTLSRSSWVLRVTISAFECGNSRSQTGVWHC